MQRRYSGARPVSLLGAYGFVSTSLAGPLGRQRHRASAAAAFRSRDPTASANDMGLSGRRSPAIKRCAGTAGINNYMTYLTGDIPVGAYQSSRLSNLGIGHGAIDAGGGYTYFNPQTGHEFSGVLGLTYNFINPRRSIRAASTCTSIGAHRSFCPSRFRWAW